VRAVRAFVVLHKIVTVLLAYFGTCHHGLPFVAGVISAITDTIISNGTFQISETGAEVNDNADNHLAN
jgi:hypothetical protein